MIPQSIQNLSSLQWVWLWEAFGRLLLVQVSIKFRQQSWLRSKIDFLDGSQEKLGLKKTELGMNTSLYCDDMYESVRLAARLIPMSTACLPRSLVLCDMLCWRGFTARTRIGVAKPASGFASHAWVEVDDCIVGEPKSVPFDFASIRKD